MNATTDQCTVAERIAVETAASLREKATRERETAASYEHPLAEADLVIAEARAALCALEDERRALADRHEFHLAVADYVEHLAERVVADAEPRAAAVAVADALPGSDDPGGHEAIDLAPYQDADVVVRTRGGLKIAGRLTSSTGRAQIRQPDGTVCYLDAADVAEISRVAEIAPPHGFDPTLPVVTVQSAPGVAAPLAGVAAPTGPGVCPECRLIAGLDDQGRVVHVFNGTPLCEPPESGEVAAPQPCPNCGELVRWDERRQRFTHIDAECTEAAPPMPPVDTRPEVLTRASIPAVTRDTGPQSVVPDPDGHPAWEHIEGPDPDAPPLEELVAGMPGNPLGTVVDPAEIAKRTADRVADADGPRHKDPTPSGAHKFVGAVGDFVRHPFGRREGDGTGQDGDGQ